MLPASRELFAPRVQSVTRAAQQGDAPLRRFVTLTEDPLQAMKKRPSHRVQRRFSGECCVKNTQAAAAEKSTRTAPIKISYSYFLSDTYRRNTRYNLEAYFGSKRLRVALAALVSEVPPSREARGGPAMVNCRSWVAKTDSGTDSEWIRPSPSGGDGGDSNPRYAFGAYNGLANRRLQPLGHVSACEIPRRSASAGQTAHGEPENPIALLLGNASHHINLR